MSFCAKVKEELCRIELQDICCITSELAGIIATSDGKLGFSNSINTENHLFARRIVMLLKRLKSNDFEIEKKNNCNFKKNIIFKIKSPILTEISTKTSSDLLQKDCCKKAFVRGLFLSTGSVSSPEKSYHVEIVLKNVKWEDLVLQIVGSFNLNPKRIARNDKVIVYLKESEDIVDFLNVMGAYNALLEIENIRVLKDVINSVNRGVNCETANLEKTVNAAVRQFEDIKLVDEVIGLKNLSKTLREIAYLRLENIEANLSEIGEMLTPPLGKSGVNHRFKKLEKIANKIRETKGVV